MPPKNTAGGENLSDVADLLKLLRDQLKIKEDMMHDWFEERDLNMETATLDIAGRGYTVDREYTDEEVSALYQKIKGEKTDANLFYYEEENGDNSPTAVKHRFILDVIAQTNDLLDDRERLEELEEDYRKNREEYVEYMTSEERDKDRMEYRERLLEMLKIMDTSVVPPSKIAAIQREATVIEQRYSLEYMIDPMDDPKLRKSLVDNFFDKRRSAYLMQKFTDKCEQLNLRPDLQRYLLNIEENFLEEEFHVFNNLFLFYCMRQIAYSDRDNVREAKQPIQGMINLIYNKFYSDDVRDTFLEAIRNFLRKFEEYRDLFNEKNILSPNHPYRKQKDAERAAMVKLSTMKQLIEDYPDAGYTFEYLETKTLEELLKMVDIHMAEDKRKEEIKNADPIEVPPEVAEEDGPRILEDSFGLEDEVGKAVEEESTEESDT